MASPSEPGWPRFHDSDAGVRRSAAKALEKLGPNDKGAVDPLVIALRDKDPDVVYEAESALARIGAPAVPALVNALRGKDLDLHAEAAVALAVVGEPAVPALTVLLNDPDEGARYFTAQALAPSGRPPSRPCRRS